MPNSRMVAVPADLLERLRRHSRFAKRYYRDHGMDESLSAVIDDRNELVALLVVPAEPETTRKTNWVKMIDLLRAEGHAEDCDRLESAGEWPLYPCSCGRKLCNIASDAVLAELAALDEDEGQQ